MWVFFLCCWFCCILIVLWCSCFFWYILFSVCLFFYCFMCEFGLVVLYFFLGELWLKWVVFFDWFWVVFCVFGFCIVDWFFVRIMKFDFSLLCNYLVIIGVVYLVFVLCMFSIGIICRCMNLYRNKVFMIIWFVVFNLMCCMLCLFYRGCVLV